MDAVVSDLGARGAVETGLATLAADALWRLDRVRSAESALTVAALARVEGDAVRDALAADREHASAGHRRGLSLPVGTTIPVDMLTVDRLAMETTLGVQVGDAHPFGIADARTMEDLRACHATATAMDDALKAMLRDDHTAVVTASTARNVVSVMMSHAGLAGEGANEVHLTTPDDYLRGVTPASAKGLGKRLGAIHGHKVDNGQDRARWTVPVLFLAAHRVCERTGRKLAVPTLVVMSLTTARHAGNRASRLISDAQRRVDAARALAGVDAPGLATVRKMETHLARTLGGALRDLRALRAPRAPEGGGAEGSVEPARVARVACLPTKSNDTAPVLVPSSAPPDFGHARGVVYLPPVDATRSE